MTVEIPERIWLQIENEGAESPDEVLIGDISDATWCVERIYDSDVEYVKANKFQETAKVLRQFHRDDTWSDDEHGTIYFDNPDAMSMDAIYVTGERRKQIADALERLIRMVGEAR